MNSSASVIGILNPKINIFLISPLLEFSMVGEHTPCILLDNDMFTIKPHVEQVFCSA